MILEIDAGNSSVKWRVTEVDGAILSRGSCPPDSKSFDSFFRALQQPCRVRVSSVRGVEFMTILHELCLEHWGVRAEFAEASARCGSVVNAYEKPQSLGVDRWLAILAAYDSCRGRCCVIDAGSAVSLDLVAENGIHLGGYIVPGMGMQRGGLCNGTNIRLEGSPEWSGVLPGRSTSSAVHNGIMSMLLDWISVRGAAVGSVLMLTGGDAQMLSVQLRLRGIDHRLIPDLVLDGLIHALP